MKADSRPSRVIKRLWYRATRRRSDREVTARVHGLSISFSPRSRIGEEIFANAFERHEREFLDELVQPSDCVVDVGANVGFFTCLLARKVGERGKIVAFEPTPSVHRFLLKNVERNGLTGRVEIRSEALSDRSGSQTMHCFSEGNEVYNSLGARRTVGGSDLPEREIEVPVTTLDDALAGGDQAFLRAGRAFVKVDVEGFEHRVLLGGRKVLEAHADCSLMVELYEPAALQCGNSTLDSIAYLDSLGFNSYVIGGSRLLVPLGEPERAALREGRLSRPNLFFLKAPAEQRLERAGMLRRKSSRSGAGGGS